MKCTEVINILDERDLGSLSEDQHREVLAHVGTCAGCSEQWHASRDLLTFRSPAPAMSDALRAKLSSLSRGAAGSTRGPRKRRPVIVVGTVLVCAAAAAALTSMDLGFGLDEARLFTEISPEPLASGRSSVVSDSSSAAAGDGSLSPSQDLATPGTTAVPNAESTPAGRRSVTVAVLPLVHLNDDPAAKTQVLQYFQEFLGPIDAHGDVIRISDSELLEFDDPDLSLREIGESISADVFVRIVNDRPQGAGLITSWPRDNWPEANRALSVEIGIPVRGRFGFGWRVERVKANSTRWDAAMDPQAQIDSQIYSIFQEAYAYIRPDLRVPGFTESLRPPGFGPGQRPGRMTEEDVRMLLDQARLAGNPAERTDVWVRLRGSEHAAIVVPALTEAALYDPVAGVRMAAVDSLMGYPETAGVRETLQAISAGEAPAALRERAAMYLRTPAEHGDYTVERLLDESLTDAERLAPLLAISLADYGDGSYRSSQYSEDVWLPNTSAVSTALVELAARTEDVRARIILIERMVFAEGSEVVDQLLEFLASDPSDDVREAAADSLAPHVDQERVRVALERAGREDP